MLKIAKRNQTFERKNVEMTIFKIIVILLNLF